MGLRQTYRGPPNRLLDVGVTVVERVGVRTGGPEPIHSFTEVTVSLRVEDLWSFIYTKDSLDSLIPNLNRV